MKINYVLLSFTLIFFLTFNLNAQKQSHFSTLISGEIQNLIDNKPIKNVSVEIYLCELNFTEDNIPIIGPNSNGIKVKTISTDDNGNFKSYINIRKETDYIFLKISSPDMESMYKNHITVNTNEETFIELKMTPSNPTKQEEAVIENKIIDKYQQKEIDKIKDYSKNNKKKLNIEYSPLSSAAACSYSSLPTNVYVSNLQDGYNGSNLSGGYTGYINFDLYVGGVVHGEIGGITSNIDTKKAQAVAARTFSLNRHNNGWSVNIGQAYNDSPNSSSSTSSSSTTNEIILYNGSVIDAKYSARCNGNYTQNANQGTWAPYSNCNTSGNYIPYLLSVGCSGHINCSQTSETPCCNATISTTNSSGYIYGHGVGMCQRGIEQFGEIYGWSYCQMLEHYYTNICVANSNCDGTSSSGLDCSNAVNLTCGSTYYGSSSSASSQVSSYGCNTWTETGPERVHTITPTASGTITATISNFSGDLDVYILGSCDPNNCLGTVSSSSATYTNAQANQTYYIVVDADDGSGSSYALTVDCPSGGGGGNEDIYLTDVSVSDNTPDCGSSITVYATQNYSGNQLDSNLPSFDLDYYLSTNTTLDNSDILLGGDISSLGSDDTSHSESGTYTLPSSLSTGIYYILFVADAESELSESNENNNIEYIAIQVNCEPNAEDIFLTDVSVSDNTLSCGNSITVYATQNYSGNQLDSNLPSFDLDYYLSTNTTLDNSDILLGGDISSLGSDDTSHSESGTYTLPSILDAGTYYILFVADADAELAEANENNNISYIAIQISCVQGNDVFIVNPSVSSTNLNCGDNITMSCSQNYSGNQLDANLPSTELHYYLSTNTTLDNSDILLDTDVSGLGSDDPSDSESGSAIIPGVSNGTYYVLFVADATDALSENNENNNIEYLTVQINCVPSNDITLTNVSVSSTNLTCGDNITISCTHSYSGNQLDDDLSNPNVAYYLSNNTLVDGGDVLLGTDVSSLGLDDLSENESITSTIPAETSAGLYYILIVADVYDEISETNENNNIEVVQININCTVEYSIVTSANPSNGGSTNGSGTFSAGLNITVTASPNPGWTFTNWTENGTVVSSNPSYQITVNSNRNLVANFVEEIQNCPTPNNITIEMTSPTNAFLSWDVVAEANYYQIWYRPQGTSEWSIKGTANTQRNVPDLITNQYYEYRLRARCGNNTWSDFSETITFYANICDIPMNILAEMTSPTNAFLSWDAVVGANYYQIWYRQQGASEWSIKGTANTQRNIPDLINNQYYEYRLRARCGNNTWSDFSEIIALSGSFCNIPTNIVAEMTTQTNAFISWDAVSGADYYQVWYRIQGTSEWSIKGTANTQRNIPGLTPYKYYQYKIRARCSGNIWSDFSNIQTTYTSTCNIPTGIASVYLDNNRMKIRWDNTTEVKGRVGYREVGTSTWSVKNSLPGNNFVYITGLTPNGLYEYRVRSNCQGSDWSAYSGLYYHNLGSPNAKESQEVDITDSSIKIYPNPVQDILNVEFPINIKGKTNISIMDHLGKKIHTKNVIVGTLNPREEINTGNLSNGYYFIVISNDTHTEVLKFVKIK